MNFVVLGLPRSRTYWLSRFLQYGQYQCMHDAVMQFRSMDDIKSWFAMPFTGSVETAASPFWRLIPADVHIVTIRRSIDDVVNSMRNLPVQFDPDSFRKHMMMLDRKLDQVERRRHVLSVNYRDLNEAGCQQIFEYCLGYPHDHDWWAHLDRMNLQENILHTISYYQAYEPQLRKLAKITKYHMLQQINRDVINNEDDGLTIQEEPFDAQRYLDGRKMFEHHSIAVGEAPDSAATKNVGLMQTLADNGMLQIMTARCNGRVFGYLMATISPTLESPDRRIACHTAFFASPEFKGLGMRLQRASVEALRCKGIDEIYMHAGVRASGPRLGTLYRRLGAHDYGQVFKLELNTAIV